MLSVSECMLRKHAVALNAGEPTSGLCNDPLEQRSTPEQERQQAGPSYKPSYLNLKRELVANLPGARQQSTDRTLQDNADDGCFCAASSIVFPCT